ncbi:MAG: hypothetical protein NUW07_10460 [Candidatus Saccharicenans sp.]|nr:hypothetical protein [Candidatus Saccharicenans sp.]
MSHCRGISVSGRDLFDGEGSGVAPGPVNRNCPGRSLAWLTTSLLYTLSVLVSAR